MNIRVYYYRREHACKCAVFKKVKNIVLLFVHVSIKKIPPSFFYPGLHVQHHGHSQSRVPTQGFQEDPKRDEQIRAGHTSSFGPEGFPTVI